VGAHHAQKTALKPWQQQPWVIPPQANAECVCAMEDVLEVYTRPYDPRRPPVGLDATSQPWVADTREPLPATPGQSARVDEEYERKGTAHLCMVLEPGAGPRRVKVTERRTAVDFAQLLQEVVDVQYPQAEQMVLVMDNLNTHTPASRYEAGAPTEARRMMERLEIQYTPKQGSWWNRAATDLRVRATPWMDRRIPDPTPLTPAVAAWQRRRNTAKSRVDWRFTTHDARITLKRRYPSIQLG
jgi:hypothetical protein